MVERAKTIDNLNDDFDDEELDEMQEESSQLPIPREEERFVVHCTSNSCVCFAVLSELPDVVRDIENTEGYRKEDLHIYRLGSEVEIKGIQVEVEEI